MFSCTTILVLLFLFFCIRLLLAVFSYSRIRLASVNPRPPQTCSIAIFLGSGKVEHLFTGPLGQLDPVGCRGAY